jgi:integrase
MTTLQAGPDVSEHEFTYGKRSRYEDMDRRGEPGDVFRVGVDENLDRPKSGPASREIRFLKVEEVEALLRAVPDDAVGPTDRVLYLTAAMTGLREGELVALRWKDVDWPAGVIRVRVNYTHGRWGTPKSGHGRAVPLADRVAAELERHYQRSSYQDDDAQVFGHPQTGRPYDASTLLSRFKSACQRAGVREVRFHDLRHTFATQMAATGVPLRALQAWLGHASYQTTEKYADYAPDPSGGRTWAERAFAPAPINPSINLSGTEPISGDVKPLGSAE